MSDGETVQIYEMAVDESVVRSDPEIMSGALCFAGTRVPVYNLFDFLAAGDPFNEFLDDFPTVRREQAVAVLMAVREPFLPDHVRHP
jgi:uncharacterized protein (DUF433 family)